MRRVVGASLLALVGCNQIFGITRTQEDIPTDVVPDRPHVVLDWQIAAVLASGAPDPVIRFAPIDPAPTVRIAPLDDPFDRDPATYTPGDGSIEIPAAYLNTTWRLEYALVGDVVPHEVQWAPEDKQGHLTVPVFGRLQHDPVPVGSGYTIIPGGVTGYSHPRVLTTGMWSEGCVVGNCTMSSGGQIDYDFYSNASSLVGARGRPEPTLGDRALLVDYIDGGSGCRIAVGSAELASAALDPGVHTVQTPTWDSGTKPVMSDAVGFQFVGRLMPGLDKLHGTFNPSSPQLFGVAPSTDMPGLAGGLEKGLLPDVPAPMLVPPLPLPLPVMQKLLQCPYSAVPPLPKTAQPRLFDSFPRILHVQLVDTRIVLGVALNSGMETVIAAGTAGGFTMAFPAKIPKQFTLATPANGTVDLAGDSEQIAVGPANGPFQLSFMEEEGTDLRADYYDVVLHQILAGALIPRRIYTVTAPLDTSAAPKVRIDGSLIAPGADYVFEVRSYKGHPQAPHGDFAPVDYPYGAAIVFTRTFKAS